MVIRSVWLVASLALTALLCAACAGRGAPTGEGARQNESASGPIVLVSGRDDHGLLREAQVALYNAPGGKLAIGHVSDATFVRVVAERGEWLRVRTVSPPHVEGWIDDFYLRDRALRTDGAGQVRFADAAVREGRVWVAVRPIQEPGVAPEWLPVERLQEVGAVPAAAHGH